MNDEIDPALIAILAQLWRAAQETPERAWSLAKLSKQSGVPMSSLIRHLTALSDAALLAPANPGDSNDSNDSNANAENKANTPTAALSEAGRELCAQLFAQTPPEIDKS
ncbi:ArsR family transcriptional regulator [Burkholderia sp. S171]|uniref:ArsR family transcriptional regulator n=1 Tax=Burkholderia sp. S171 TaxID=1641860 RepID=UPI00131DAFA6|nr:ArsR family transcriptional regulator [Burkholderia sp. S171]